MAVFRLSGVSMKIIVLLDFVDLCKETVIAYGAFNHYTFWRGNVKNEPQLICLEIKCFVFLNMS